MIQVQWSKDAREIKEFQIKEELGGNYKEMQIKVQGLWGEGTKGMADKSRKTKARVKSS